MNLINFNVNTQGDCTIVCQLFAFHLEENFWFITINGVDRYLHCAATDRAKGEQLFSKTTEQTNNQTTLTLFWLHAFVNKLNICTR